MVNGVKCKNIIVDGKLMEEGYVDGKHVYSRVLVLHLPQFSASTDIIKWLIEQLHGESHSEINIINDRTQPSLNFYSGSVTSILKGANITFTNNKEIQASAVSGLAMMIHVPITLINNGWIRGGGGNGGTGGKGGVGGKGHAGANDTYVKYVYLKKYAFHGCNQNQTNNYFIATGGQGGSRMMMTWAGHNHWFSKVDTSWHRLTGYSSTYYFRKSSSHGHINCPVPNSYYVERRQTTHPRRTGGAGGNGGGGGAGGGGGHGQYYGHGSTAGAGGHGGGVGAGGHGSSPSGGHTGYRGGHGATGGTGGHGGSWGAGGARGNTGGKGSTGEGHGSGGGGGLAGAYGGGAGKAIDGKSNLKTGSKTGHVNGAIV